MMMSMMWVELGLRFLWFIASLNSVKTWRVNKYRELS